MCRGGARGLAGRRRRTIRPIIDQVLTLDEVAKAHQVVTDSTPHRQGAAAHLSA